MRIGDWSSDVCSSDLLLTIAAALAPSQRGAAQLQAQRLQPFDLFAVGLDAAPHEERGSGQEDNRGDQDSLPDLLLVADEDRKSAGSGKSVSVRVDLGGRRILKQKNTRAH